MITALTISFHKLQRLLSVSLFRRRRRKEGLTTTAVFGCSYSCKETNKLSQSTIIFTIIRLSMRHSRKISSPDCRKVRFWETFKIFWGEYAPRPPLEVQAFGPQLYSVPTYSQGSALLLQK